MPSTSESGLSTVTCFLKQKVRNPLTKALMMPQSAQVHLKKRKPSTVPWYLKITMMPLGASFQFSIARRTWSMKAHRQQLYPLISYTVVCTTPLQFNSNVPFFSKLRYHCVFFSWRMQSEGWVLSQALSVTCTLKLRSQFLNPIAAVWCLSGLRTLDLRLFYIHWKKEFVYS